MDVFGSEDYYPAPSDKVIMYRDALGSMKKHAVLKADLVALIVHLSSPVGEVDYNAISDLFLVYRNFISPMELSDLLIARLRWCISETTSTIEQRKKIGKIALVRTFVLVRHWILNYFVQDFLSDVNLRLRVIKFLNEPCDVYPRIIKSTIVNLKKAWIHRTKNVWTNLSLDEPDMIGGDDEWDKYQIKDYSQLEDVRKRDSQLSFYAKQGTSSPNFRNRSVLCLFKASDNFELPKKPGNGSKKPATQRTGSMVLYPCDNSNIKNEKDDHQPLQHEAVSKEEESLPAKSKKTISHFSKMTNVSNIMKDIKCPEYPGIDKVIPPTPAKRVEFILKLPESLDPSADEKEDGDDSKSKKKAKSSSVQAARHRSAMGLLSKWKKNHSNFKAPPVKSTSDHINNGHTKPAMDTFVKYVISITSLENREHENEELSNLVLSKFDILSARTIEEVEFLVSMENELLKEVRDTVPQNNVSSKENDYNHMAEQNFGSSQIGFSAADNLNLYQTVSSIANSVISLSKTLDQHRKQQPPTNTLSPSFAALERRKVQSSIAMMSHNRSRFSLISQSNCNEEKPNQNNDGPQRLVFHDNNGCKKFSGISSSDPVLSFSPSKRPPLQPSNRTSPLKQVLPNVYEIKPQSNEQRDSFTSSISYDSQLSNANGNHLNGLQTSNSDENEFTIKRKLAQANLREFTFEDKKEEARENAEVRTKEGVEAKKEIECKNDVQIKFGGEESEKVEHIAFGNRSKDVVSTSSFVTTREFEQESDLSTPVLKTPSSRATASGRISLIRKQNSRSSRRESNLKLPVEKVEKDIDFIQKDKELLINELEILELEKKTPLRSSVAMSVNTDVLFNSKNNSPRKQIEQSQVLIGLNKIPSIQSIDDCQSFSVKSAADTFKNGVAEQAVKYNGTDDSIIPALNQEVSVDSSFNFSNSNENEISVQDIISNGLNNKYLFSPDSDNADIASPAKNVEELKDRFLKKEDTDEDIEARNIQDRELASPKCDKSHTHQENERLKVLNRENIVDIANLPDDSVHDDPVNVALMKLEGTYHRSTDEKSNAANGSPTPSDLADEVDMLDIAELAMQAASPADKRRSLLIERRRQTMMEVPFTPINQTPDGQTKPFAQPEKIAELFKGYETRDQRLLVSNSEEHVPFILMYDSLSIAQQMTLIERELLGEIDWNELLNLNLAYTAPHVTSWLQLLVQNETLSGIDLAIARFNLTVDWIISEIVLTSDTRLKRNTIQRFIHVAEHCRSFQNFNTLMEIVLALSSTVVQKFSEAWRLIEPGDLLAWEELKQIPSLDRNYSSIRKLLNSTDPIKGCVPFIVVYLSDLSLNSEKRTWFVPHKVVNYNKFDTNVQIVKNFIEKVQWSKFYDFATDNELLSKCVYLTALTAEEITYLTSSNAKES